MARRPRGEEPPEPTTNPATGETETETWRRWSDERAERERLQKSKVQAEADAYTERAIFTIEIARAVAQQHGRRSALNGVT
jgi:hypothetical protein